MSGIEIEQHQDRETVSNLCTRLSSPLESDRTHAQATGMLVKICTEFVIVLLLGYNAWAAELGDGRRAVLTTAGSN